MHEFPDYFCFMQAKNTPISLIQQENTPNTRVFPEIFKFFALFFSILEKNKTGYHKIVITGFDFPNNNRQMAIFYLFVLRS